MGAWWSYFDAEQIRKTLLATPAKLTEETVPRLIIFWHRRELIVGSSLLFLDCRFVSACNILPHMCRFTIDGISDVNKKKVSIYNQLAGVKLLSQPSSWWWTLTYVTECISLPNLELSFTILDTMILMHAFFELLKRNRQN